MKFFVRYYIVEEKLNLMVKILKVLVFLISYVIFNSYLVFFGFGVFYL